jgi:CubicO group peptidase (beta-lactamase class C family)
VAPGYEGVRAALERVVGPGEGAVVAAVVEGRPVVDLWAGTVPERGLVHTFSAIKPLAATCVLLLVERGHLALDDPVVRWWPEIGAAGKGDLRVAHLLAHQAGLVTVPAAAADLLDGEATAAALAAAVPDWPPGQAHGEHALTYGNLLGELVRRVDGRSLGRFLADELAGPSRSTSTSAYPSRIWVGWSMPSGPHRRGGPGSGASRARCAGRPSATASTAGW